MRRSKGRAKPNAESNEAGLRLQQPAEALSALLRERGRLLKKIAAKQQELEQECETIRSTMLTLMSKMQGLVIERNQLVDEMHRLFDELLVEGRLSRSARKKASAVYQIIKESNDFEPLDFDAFARPANTEPSPGFSESETNETGPAPHHGTAAASARHAGGQPGNDTLRGLFRRLTVALHPDRVQHEGEQKRRTDVMKEVTRAYEDGDFARLIEIEQQWMVGGHVESGANDEAAKREALERTIKELQSQLKTVTGELRFVRASSPLRELFGSSRRRRVDDQGPIDAMVASANEDLERMRQMRDFVRAFGERKISLAEFMRGPACLRPDDFDEEFDYAQVALDSLLDDFVVVPSNRPKGRQSRRKSKRSSAANDVPF